jgi:hypothetical protein
MNSFTQLIQNVRNAQWADANKVFAEIMQQKVADRLQAERQTIFKEDAQGCTICGSKSCPGADDRKKCPQYLQEPKE